MRPHLINDPRLLNDHDLQYWLRVAKGKSFHQLKPTEYQVSCIRYLIEYCSDESDSITQDFIQIISQIDRLENLVFDDANVLTCLATHAKMKFAINHLKSSYSFFKKNFANCKDLLADLNVVITVCSGQSVEIPTSDILRIMENLRWAYDELFKFGSSTTLYVYKIICDYFSYTLLDFIINKELTPQPQKTL